MAEDSSFNKDKDNKQGARGAGGSPEGRGRRNRPPRAEGGPRPAAEGGATPPQEGARASGEARPQGERRERPPGDRPQGDRPQGDRPQGERREGRGPRDNRGPRDDRRGPRDDRRSDTASPLTASLFSAMQDKQVPCRIAGCQNTWTWFAAQQIRGFGQPPPDRMCDEHLAQFNELADREVPCRTPGCPNTWLWKRGAQLAELQRTGKLRRPARLCAECFNAERETHDVELPCKISGCRRTWTWNRDAQLRHRLWVLRQRAKAARPAVEARTEEPRDEVKAEEARPVEAVAEVATATETPETAAAAEAVSSDMSEGTATTTTATTTAEPAEEERRKRRRKRRRGSNKAAPSPEGPPERMCGLCAQKLGRLQAKELPCKVHGCTRSWTWDRASQMRAWVASGSDDVDFEPASPKRMCEVCREFCRTHPDREVACGRPGCTSTWTYKTGAQLQAFLAGRTADPLKLCGECSKGEFAATFRPSGDAVPEGAEIMPCVVSGCDGTWVYIPGMKLRETSYGELSTDRMCPKCRRERGLDGGDAPVEVTAADLEPDPADEVDEAVHEVHGEHEAHEAEGAEGASDELEADASEVGGDELVDAVEATEATEDGVEDGEQAT